MVLEVEQSKPFPGSLLERAQVFMELETSCKTQKPPSLSFSFSSPLAHSPILVEPWVTACLHLWAQALSEVALIFWEVHEVGPNFGV